MGQILWHKKRTHKPRIHVSVWWFVQAIRRIGKLVSRGEQHASPSILADAEHKKQLKYKDEVKGILNEVACIVHTRADSTIRPPNHWKFYLCQSGAKKIRTNKLEIQVYQRVFSTVDLLVGEVRIRAQRTEASVNWKNYFAMRKQIDLRYSR